MAKSKNKYLLVVLFFYFVSLFPISAFAGIGGLCDDFARAASRGWDDAAEVAIKTASHADEIALDAARAASHAQEIEIRRSLEFVERQFQEQTQRAARELEERQVQKAAHETAEQLAREQTERQAKEQAERAVREQAEYQAKETAEQLAREQTEWQAKEQTEQVMREQAEYTAKVQDENSFLAKKAEDEKAFFEKQRADQEFFESKKLEDENFFKKKQADEEWFNKKEFDDQLLAEEKVLEAEKALKRGGKYADVRAANKGGEVHHMPANSTNDVPHGQGSSIHMETKDHYETASWGNSKDAQEYREIQRKLQEKGRLDDAIQMDIDDVTSKFSGKYDDHILQMIDDLD